MERLHEVVRKVTAGKVEGIAIDVNKTASAIYKYGEDPTGTGVPIPGNMIVPISKLTGDHSIVKYLANRLGLVVFKIPDGSSPDININKLASLVKGFGESLQAASSAIEDYKITRAEMAKIEKEFIELITLTKATMEYFRTQIMED